MAKCANLLGKKLGKLTIIKREENSPNGESRWLCACDCGNTTIQKGGVMLAGRVVSCGCHARATTSARMKIHGKSHTKEYFVWIEMKQRCNNPNNCSYERYGARGIKVCDEWNASFEEFISDMGMCPVGMSIDRKDVNGNYTKENCKWSTLLEQNNNTRLTVWTTEDDGTRISAMDAARKYGINGKTLKYRLHQGFSLMQSVSMIRENHRKTVLVKKRDQNGKAIMSLQQ